MSTVTERVSGHTDLVKALIDRAAEDPSAIDRVADALNVGGALAVSDSAETFRDWPPPSREARDLALQAAQAAIACVQKGARLLRLDSLYSRSRAVPQPRFEFSGQPSTKIVFSAPLVVECLEEAARYELATLIAYRHGEASRKLATDESRLNHSRRLNNYLRLEAELWWIAQVGGFPDPVPYAVRFEAAGWLWSPELTNAAVFCLRCGSKIEYQRAGRGDTDRRARCAACSRGQVNDWPQNAIAPTRRGWWWLRCGHDGCDPFEGTRRAKWCPEHKSSRLTASKRAGRSVVRQ